MPGNAEAPFLLRGKDVSALYSPAMRNTTSLFTLLWPISRNCHLKAKDGAISPTGNFRPSRRLVAERRIGALKTKRKAKDRENHV
jgi:hypothetical protein